MKEKFKIYVEKIISQISKITKESGLKRVMEDHKKALVIGGVVLCLCLGSLIYFNHKKTENIAKTLSHTEKEENGNISSDEKNDEIPDETSDEYIIVDIDGAVNNPIMVELPGKSRLDAAINAAGGLAKNADTTKINRAEILRDGQKIYIPKIGEINYEAKNGNVVGKGGKKVNLNTATSDDLRTINGIGPGMAEKIITYREEHGAFKKLEDLKEINGIGEKTYEKLKNYLKI